MQVRGRGMPLGISGLARSFPKATGPATLSPQAEAIVGENKITIHARDLKKIAQLGRGKYGYVDRARHVPSGIEVAVKHITIHQEIETMTNLQRDLGVGRRCQSPYLIESYCGLYYECEILIVMELMDTSLDKLIDKVYKSGSVLSENLLAYITYCVVSGLEYLHRNLKVIHRDVKPSNILADREGGIKVCDYGISGDLVDSHAQTYFGSSSYLAPERIEPKDDQGYRIQSDVWSLGLTLIELAIGKPCYQGYNDIFQLLDCVVKRDPPTLPPDGPYSDTLRYFISRCLVKDEKQRADYVQLLNTEFLQSVDVDAGREAMSECMRIHMPDS